MLNLRRFSMKQLRRANHSAAEYLTNRLMTQADTENGDLTGELFNYIH